MEPDGEGRPLFATRMNAQGVPQRTPNAVSCFDDSKLTLNALSYEHDAIFRSPADRIAMYNSPHALHLTMAAAIERIPGSAFSSPAPAREPDPPGSNPYRAPSPPPETSAESAQHCAAFSRRRALPLTRSDAPAPLPAAEQAAHERYRELVASIDVATRVVDSKPEWMHNACHWARLDAFPAIPGALKDAMVRDMLADVRGRCVALASCSPVLRVRVQIAAPSLRHTSCACAACPCAVRVRCVLVRASGAHAPTCAGATCTRACTRAGGACRGSRRRVARGAMVRCMRCVVPQSLPQMSQQM